MMFSTLPLRAVAIIFLFIAKISFPVQNSIINILQNRYDDQLIRKVRKIEKFDFKYKKAKLNRGVLITCKDEKLHRIF